MWGTCRGQPAAVTLRYSIKLLGSITHEAKTAQTPQGLPATSEAVAPSINSSVGLADDRAAYANTES
jgi:hypothetical protein